MKWQKIAYCAQGQEGRGEWEEEIGADGNGGSGEEQKVSSKFFETASFMEKTACQTFSFSRPKTPNWYFFRESFKFFEKEWYSLSFVEVFLSFTIRLLPLGTRCYRHFRPKITSKLKNFSASLKISDTFIRYFCNVFKSAHFLPFRISEFTFYLSLEITVKRTRVLWIYVVCRLGAAIVTDSISPFAKFWRAMKMYSPLSTRWFRSWKGFCWLQNFERLLTWCLAPAITLGEPLPLRCCYAILS